MTDKELLELAAKAAGITLLEWYGTEEEYWATYTPRGENIGWNPLTDDGDAFRLAITVRLGVQINDASILICFPQKNDGETLPDLYAYPDRTYDENYEVQYLNHDIVARRAIVRAAAEIERSKQNG